MSDSLESHLPRHLWEVLVCSSKLGTTETMPIAASLCLSDLTVDTYWKRIKSILGIKKRYEAVGMLRKGTITARATAPLVVQERASYSEDASS